MVRWLHSFWNRRRILLGLDPMEPPMLSWLHSSFKSQLPIWHWKPCCSIISNEHFQITMYSSAPMGRPSNAIAFGIVNLVIRMFPKLWCNPIPLRVDHKTLWNHRCLHGCICSLKRYYSKSKWILKSSNYLKHYYSKSKCTSDAEWIASAQTLL